MKPDIVAPGYIIMAPNANAGTGESDTREVLGTSYAAPAIAGAAAQVRQYFEEGWFPCGSKGCGTSINPSGSLVKAVLMNSGQDLIGVQDVMTNKNVIESLKPYDNSQGMGLVKLASTLPLVDEDNANTRIINGLVQNNVPIDNNEVHTFVVRASMRRCPSSEMSVTLAWYDTGAANGCVKCLLNDLDVWVQNVRFNGTPTGARFRANGTTWKDDRNNVERVRFNMTNRRRYQITVQATNLSAASIKYSLIATGCFTVISG